MSDTDQGSFVSGFALGVFAGAAGYYFFGTEKGRQARLQIQEEWQVAKVDLVKKGVIANKDVSIRDVMRQIFAEMVGPEWINQETQTKQKKTKSIKAKMSPLKDKKFKNTKA